MMPTTATTPSQSLDLSVDPAGVRLGERLVKAGLVTQGQVTTALQANQHGTGKRLGQLLVELGLVDEHDLARTLAEQHSLDTVDLRRVTPQPAATALMSEAAARSLTAIPVSFDGEQVTVAVADATDSIVTSLWEVIGKPVTIQVATQADIVRAIGNSYRALSGVDSQVQAFEAGSAEREVAHPEVTIVAADAPIVQVVQLMIVQGLRDRASDIHIEPQAGHVRVRYRIDGALHDILDLPGNMGPALVSRVKILADMDIIERRRPQDGQISLDVEGHPVDIRVSTTTVVGGEKVVLRLLDKSRPLLRLEQLGMSEKMSSDYSEMLRSPYGMMICAGPTGSGKTTTLYASLHEINSPERNIMTIEDPVEYIFTSTNQIQINEQTGVTFASGLRSILRQDPDIILVGEIRDEETARIAVQSALTGHFVLSSLHAADAVSALHRLLDMDIESFLVASAITGVLAQRLVRRICSNCSERYEPSTAELAFLDVIGGTAPAGGFIRGVGCNYCANTGYLERIGVYEYLPISEPIRKLVLNRASRDELRALAQAEGMRTMLQESAHLIASGVTTITEVLKSIYTLGA